MVNKDKRSGKSQGEQSSDSDVTAPRIPIEQSSGVKVTARRQSVSQTGVARDLRQALITAGLREGFRIAFKTMIGTLFGVDVDPQPLELPEVDDLFDDIEVIEPMEDVDPE